MWQKNNFAAVCFSKTQQNHRSFSRHNRGADSRDVRCATCESDDSDIQHLDFVNDSVKHLRIGRVGVHRVSDLIKTVPIVINDVIVHM
jgi:hypothetical protein